MEKNTAKAKTEQWVSGPVDWEDVSLVRRALENWEKGAQVDFKVSEDLFYKLLECSGADDDFFAFSDGRVRFKGWDANDHESRQQLVAERAAGDLDFPLTLSRAARWYCFANVYTACSMPEYVPEVLGAKDYAAARCILQDALRKARADLDGMVAMLLSTPEKPAMARHQATRDRDAARKRERAVQGCLDALNAAAELAAKDELLTLLRERGMAETQVDFLDFLEVTTFDSNEEYPHTAADGLYTYRKNAEGEVIGVASGPAAQQLGSGEPRKIAANHQRCAALSFPIALQALVEWVFAQGGDVQFAMPGADEAPDSWGVWVSAISTHLGDRARPSAGNGAVWPRNPTKKEPMSAKERGKKGGNLSNAANKEVRQMIISDYQSGGTESKNAAAAELATKFKRAEATVRGMLKGVEWKGVGGS